MVPTDVYEQTLLESMKKQSLKATMSQDKIRVLDLYQPYIFWCIKIDVSILRIVIIHFIFSNIRQKIYKQTVIGVKLTISTIHISAQNVFFHFQRTYGYEIFLVDYFNISAYVNPTAHLRRSCSKDEEILLL